MSSSLNQGSLGSGSAENNTNGSSIENTSSNSSSPYGSISQSSSDNNDDDKLNTTAYSESDIFIQNLITTTGDTIIHPYTITILVILGLIIYIKNTINPDPFNNNSFLESVVWTLLFAVLFIDILHYYLNIHISKIVQNIYEFILDTFKFIKDFLFHIFGVDQVVDNGSPENEPILDEEVFHIPGNKYTFTEADGLCKAFGARLANYDEVESAYNKGGEWCSYGWSEGQMAYFPTQKSTFNELQKYPKQKNNCGRPGVNGGYMANPYIKFGVNCYGMKPDMKNKDEKYMEASKTKVHKTNHNHGSGGSGQNSQNTDNVIVASFNTTDWNQYERM